MNDVKLRLDYFLTKCKLANGDIYTDTRGRDVIVGKGLLDTGAANSRCSSNAERFIKSFVTRKNTGVQPVGDGVPVVVGFSESCCDDDNHGSADLYQWNLKMGYVKTWKPDLDALIKMQIKHDKKTSMAFECDEAIKRMAEKINRSAYVQSIELKDNGELKITRPTPFLNFNNFENEFSKVGLAAKSKRLGYSITKCDNHYSVTFKGDVVESGFNYIREAQERADELNDGVELDAAKEKQVNELIDFIREHGNHTDITGMAKLMQKRGLLAEILLPLEK